MTIDHRSAKTNNRDELDHENAIELDQALAAARDAVLTELRNGPVQGLTCLKIFYRVAGDKTEITGHEVAPTRTRKKKNNRRGR